MNRITLTIASLLSAMATHGPVFADEPTIEGVTVTRQGMDWRVDVTLAHPDTGWDHYADGWEVLDAEGNQLGYRKLHHPHVTEQPFTRSLSNIMIPDGAQEIYVKVSCSTDGWSSDAIRVLLNP